METTFRAYRAHREDGHVVSRIETIGLDDLSPGDVIIRAAFSSANYKDALAMTGSGKIMRRFPLVGGIDVSGTVCSSTDDRFHEGDRVLVTGCGLSEDHDGGYAEYVRVPGDWVVPLPAAMSLDEAMALGTAGFTAALAIHRMEVNGQTPGKGPVVVTGATGGVGSLAIDMLAARGYEVVALTGKRGATAFLRNLGAREILNHDDLELGTRPLEKATWGGAIDNLGGDVLTWLTRTVRPVGNIASIGLVASIDLHTTVMPFILRGVNLLGINSVFVERELRIELWDRLVGDLRPPHIDSIVTRKLTLDELPGCMQDFIDGTVTGRTIVALT